MKNVRLDSWCPGQELNLAHPKYKSEVLLLEATCFVSELFVAVVLNLTEPIAPSGY
jgi:hypothetical protein